MTVPLASVLWDSFLPGYVLTFLPHPEDSASKTALPSDFRARGFARCGDENRQISSPSRHQVSKPVNWVKHGIHPLHLRCRFSHSRAPFTAITALLQEFFEFSCRHSLKEDMCLIVFGAVRDTGLLSEIIE